MLLAEKISIEKRVIVALSFIFVSFLLIMWGFDKVVSGYLVNLGPLGAFIAGAFYTLGATSPFAMVVSLELMNAENPWMIAFFVSFSAMIVDCFLFMALKETLENSTKRIVNRLQAKTNKFSSTFPVFGFLVFGLPLPDELGLALMEMTTIDLVKLGAVIFCSKFLTLMAIRMALIGGT